MNSQFGKRPINSGNPFANALVVIIGVLTIAASLVLGVVAMIILGSIVLVLAAVIGIRIWWFKRKLARQSRDRPDNPDMRGPEIIEGEYRVISQDPSRDRQQQE